MLWVLYDTEYTEFKTQLMRSVICLFSSLYLFVFLSSPLYLSSLVLWDLVLVKLDIMVLVKPWITEIIDYMFILLSSHSPAIFMFSAFFLLLSALVWYCYCNFMNRKAQKKWTASPMNWSIFSGFYHLATSSTGSWTFLPFYSGMNHGPAFLSNLFFLAMFMSFQLPNFLSLCFVLIIPVQFSWILTIVFVYHLCAGFWLEVYHF